MTISLASMMLERCAQTIEQVIIPSLTEDFPSAQATAIAAVLRILAPTLAEERRELKGENDGMRDVLGSVLDVLRSEKALSQNAVRNGLIERLDHELGKVELGPPDVREENYNLKGALVEAVKSLDALAEALPVETISFLRQQIRSVIRQQLDHSLAAGSDLLIGRVETMPLKYPTSVSAFLSQGQK